MMQRPATGRAMAPNFLAVIIAMATPASMMVMCMAAEQHDGAATKTAVPDGEIKCGPCSPCGSGCPVVYPSPPPPPPSPPPPSSYYYYSPPPPSYLGVSYCPPPPAPYMEIVGTPSGLYPQDPGFLPSSAPHRSHVIPFTVYASCALVGLWVYW